MILNVHTYLPIFRGLPNHLPTLSKSPQTALEPPQHRLPKRRRRRQSQRLRLPRVRILPDRPRQPPRSNAPIKTKIPLKLSQMPHPPNPQSPLPPTQPLHHPPRSKAQQLITEQGRDCKVGGFRLGERVRYQFFS
jgi:hypothetical protein